MSAEREGIISERTTKRFKWGGIVAGVLGLLTELTALAVGGAVIATAAVIYESRHPRKSRSHSGGH